MLPDAGMVVVAIAQRAVLIGEVESSLLFNILSIQFEVAIVRNFVSVGKITIRRNGVRHLCAPSLFSSVISLTCRILIHFLNFKSVNSFSTRQWLFYWYYLQVILEANLGLYSLDAIEIIFVA